MQGSFIVLEGIDGAGTTTQAQRLASALRAQSHAVRVTREPSDGPIGSMLRLILTGRVANPDRSAPDWQTMALLFAADRMDHVRTEIEPFIAAGGIIISDRYDASSLAYQSVGAAADALPWIHQLNRFARRPDLTLVLDVPAEVARERRAVRGEAEQLYEQDTVQRSLAAFYRKLPEYLPQDRVVLVDGSEAPDVVTAALLKEVLTVLRS